MTVLVVEDDSFYALKLVELLHDRGVDADQAGSVQEALGKNISDYSAVIIDVMLPNDPVLSGVAMDESRGGCLAGVALARRLRTASAHPPLVLLSSEGPGGEAQRWADDNSVHFVWKYDGPKAVLRALQEFGVPDALPPPRAFIVHGHDDAAVAELKDYLQNTLHWQEPIILREQISAGRTIIEKFEDFGVGIDCVFVLMTPDDATYVPINDDQRRRARQNVVFELGFFYAHFGRRSGRVFVLRKGSVELPSDIDGIVWIDVTSGVKAAGEQIRREVAGLAT
jgi:CheY-like chemotaxis protein